MASKTSKTDQNSSKSEKFAKLASTRTQKVLDTLDVLGNCFNRANYEYTPEQVEKIMTALEAKLTHLRSLTEPGKKATENAFTL